MVIEIGSLWTIACRRDDLFIIMNSSYSDHYQTLFFDCLHSDGSIQSRTMQYEFAYEQVAAPNKAPK